MRLPRIAVVIFLLVNATLAIEQDDLVAEESQSKDDPFERETEPPRKYSSRIKSISSFGLKTSSKQEEERENIKTAAAGNGNNKSKEDQDEEKTLAQQVADGKYGLIQNEIFANGSKRPGIISYLPNNEVPRDTIQNLGGLDSEEIWLAEDHVLVLKGGIYSDKANETVPWPPIDDYVAPTRQVLIPENPSVPPPFPVQLTENGPLEFIRGQNGSIPQQRPFLPPYPFPNRTVPFPIPPPFFGNLPPGAAFLPPPVNISDFDEDDPSIYYPPKYDFIYHKPNSSVPAGPLVPGIVLPPPPNFFGPVKPVEEENETDSDKKKTPFVGPAYLPARIPYKSRTIVRPTTEKVTVAYVYPENKTTKSFTSPIFVPNSDQFNNVAGPIPSPKPNHISLPSDKPLKQDIYIVTTQPPDVDNNINDIPNSPAPTKPTIYDKLNPEIHPLRTLIKPNVSVSYVGKVGHLPASTPFPYSKRLPPPTGHFITLPPDVTVTPVPIVKKIRVKPQETSTKSTSQATLYFYEEPTQVTPEENEVSAAPIESYDKLKSKIKYHYVPNRQTLKALEIEPAGLSGLQSVKTTTTTLAPKIPKTQLFTVTTPRPQTTTDSPFIPSNYYATADPSTMHFTPIDHSIVDDMTMKYFTIFGKKINGGTTPLTPTTTTKKYIPYQPHTTPKPVYIAKSKPLTHFEQFLQEITGEDQSAYIKTQNLGNMPVKPKKGKSRPLLTNPKTVYKQYQQPTGLSQYLEDIYHPTYSTTLRPVTNIELTPEYRLSTTQRPFETKKPVIVPPSHNYGQYLQEVTSYSNPKLIGQSNLQYFSASTPAPVHQVSPISLQDDILVNFQRPLPDINPDAEFINFYNPSSNIKIVEAPNLTRKRPIPPRKHIYTHPKTLYENSGYFSPNPANAFISYNLPGNGGHFYFLTPQAVDRSDIDDDEVPDNLNYVKRSNENPRRWTREPSSQDFHRHRRKRP